VYQNQILTTHLVSQPNHYQILHIMMPRYQIKHTHMKTFLYLSQCLNLRFLYHSMSIKNFSMLLADVANIIIMELIGFSILNYLKHCHTNDFNIQPIRPVTYIPKVMFNTPFHLLQLLSFSSPPINLSPTSDPRFNRMP